MALLRKGVAAVWLLIVLLGLLICIPGAIVVVVALPVAGGVAWVTCWAVEQLAGWADEEDADYGDEEDADYGDDVWFT